MKKMLSVILVIVVVLSVASVTASAKGIPAYDDGYCCENAENSSYCNDLGYMIRLAVVQQLVKTTNAKIEALVNKAMNQQNPNLDRLVAQTNALAKSTIRIAASLGIEVVCEYKAYEINGVIVYIDPLIVIKR